MVKSIHFHHRKISCAPIMALVFDKLVRRNDILHAISILIDAIQNSDKVIIVGTLTSERYIVFWAGKVPLKRAVKAAIAERTRDVNFLSMCYFNRRK